MAITIPHPHEHAVTHLVLHVEQHLKMAHNVMVELFDGDELSERSLLEIHDAIHALDLKQPA
jgi:hypothetical protein